MFEKFEHANLSELHFHADESTQLKSIIAIHSTLRGPALGGCRCVEYSSDDDAIDDVVRLAKGMSYKAALADVPQGGGKAVILKPKVIDDRKALYQSFGKFVDSLGGRYITAVDSGTQLADMDQVHQVTPYVSGCSNDGFDPSPITALGVFCGIKAALAFKRNTDSLVGVHVAIQGLGNVGFALAELLHNAGATLTVCDIDIKKQELCEQRFGATSVAPEEIIHVPCDLLAPCGLGAIINDNSIPHLACEIIAGSANNQLAEHRHGEVLHQKGILYVPDYVINAGGLIQVSLGSLNTPQQDIIKKTANIGKTLQQIFERSKQDNVSTHTIADDIAEGILGIKN
ncbi:MAG: amino acid dehydrogenase [Moraxellaceae bacterium]|nr:MAG: amino acid dehydrogenase [Moraxellaceae bacterium]